MRRAKASLYPPTEALVHAHRMLGNRAVSRALLQRYGGVQGLAQSGTLAQGTRLFHGTPALRFTHAHLEGAGPSPIHYRHPPVPGAPAWFSPNILFAMHAGVRTFPPGQSGAMMLYSYRPRSQVNLLLFDDVVDLSVFLAEQEGVPPVPLASNDVPAALRFARLALISEGGHLDGYSLDEDPVRGEREIVLFEPGLRKLDPDPIELTVTAQQPLHLAGVGAVPYHRITTSMGGHMGSYLHTGGPGTFLGPD